MTASPNLGALYGAHSVDTFLGLPHCSDLAALTAPIAILGAPGATPYATVGAYCRNAPAALRQAMAHLAANVDRHDFEAAGRLFPSDAPKPVDCGDLPFDEADFAANRRAIRDAVGAIIARGAVPVLIGGDDSVPIPFLEGLAGRARDITILQIDAHIDWRDEHMGERFGLSSTMRRASEMAHIGAMVQVGARGIGSAATSDYEAALAHGVRFVRAEELHRTGVASALDLIPPGSDIAICFDADGLDPSIMPAAIGRAPGGLSYWQALDLLRGAADRGRIVGMAFVEFMAELDVDGLGALLFGRLVAESLGILARQSQAASP